MNTILAFIISDVNDQRNETIVVNVCFITKNWKKLKS